MKRKLDGAGEQEEVTGKGETRLELRDNVWREAEGAKVEQRRREGAKREGEERRRKTRQRWRDDVWSLDSQIKHKSSSLMA